MREMKRESKYILFYLHILYFKEEMWIEVENWKLHTPAKNQLLLFKKRLLNVDFRTSQQKKHAQGTKRVCERPLLVLCVRA